MELQDYTMLNYVGCKVYYFTTPYADISVAHIERQGIHGHRTYTTEFYMQLDIVILQRGIRRHLALPGALPLRRC